MSCAANSGFHLVYELEILPRIVTFLASGFGWDINKSNAILAHFKRLKTSAPRAAFFSENGEIKIAILLFDQTDIEVSSNRIINLASWYAKESHRGIDSIRFAKTLTSKLSKYTITNYTPSPAVKRVLVALGYKQMNVEKVSFGIDNKFPFIQLRHKKKYFAFSPNAVEPARLSFDKDLSISEVTFQIAKVRKMGINLNILNIFLGKEERSISLLWLIKYCLFHGVVKVNIFSETANSSRESPWLIKNIQTARYICPRKSELSIQR